MRTEGPVGIRGRDGGVCVAMRMREWDRRGECRRGRMSAWRGSGGQGEFVKESKGETE